MAACLAAMTVFSCAMERPDTEEQYRHRKQVDAYGRYVFHLDFTEPDGIYDVSFYATLGCRDREYAGFEGLPLQVLWQSPSDRLYEDEVWFSREDGIGGDHFSKQFGSVYGSGLVPKERGEWTLYLSLPLGQEEKYDLQGLGIRYTRKK